MFAIDTEPSAMESTLLTIGIIGGLVAAIVVGLFALRNRRR
jgi:MYXO-CTERM domain-containing protein